MSLSINDAQVFAAALKRVGDKVLIVETRPMSKNKHFRLAEIIEKAK